MAGTPPYIAVRIQELYGLKQIPALAMGRVRPVLGRAFPFDERRLRHHVDRLVPRVGPILGRADVDAQVAAGAVLRRHLDRVGAPLELEPLVGHRLERVEVPAEVDHLLVHHDGRAGAVDRAADAGAGQQTANALVPTDCKEGSDRGTIVHASELVTCRGPVDGVRGDASVENLAKLKPFFDRKYGNVTPGNSSQITDGAAWLILASEDLVTVEKFVPGTSRLHLGRLVSVSAGYSPL